MSVRFSDGHGALSVGVNLLSRPRLCKQLPPLVAEPITDDDDQYVDERLRALGFTWGRWWATRTEDLQQYVEGRLRRHPA
eukprot:6056347-Prymnesium_polylepis.1